MFIKLFSMVSIYNSVCPAEAMSDTARLMIVPPLLGKIAQNFYQPYIQLILQTNTFPTLEQRFPPKVKAFSICLAEASLDTATLKQMSFSTEFKPPKRTLRYRGQLIAIALPSKPSEVIAGAQSACEGKKHSICLVEAPTDTAVSVKKFSPPTGPLCSSPTSSCTISIIQRHLLNVIITTLSLVSPIGTLRWITMNRHNDIFVFVKTQVSVSLNKQSGIVGSARQCDIHCHPAYCKNSETENASRIFALFRPGELRYSAN